MNDAVYDLYWKEPILIKGEREKERNRGVEESTEGGIREGMNRRKENKGMKERE